MSQFQTGTYRNIACMTTAADPDTPVTDVTGKGGDIVLSALKDLTDSAAQDVLRHRSGPPMRCFGKELVLTHPFLEATGFNGSPTYSATHTTIGYQSLVIVGNGSSNVNHYGGSIWPSTNLSDPNDATALHPRLRFRFRIHVPGETATGGLMVFLFSDSGNSNAASTAVFGSNANTLKPGTHEIEMQLSATSAFGTFDPTAVTGIGFRLASTSTNGVEVHIQCPQLWIDYAPATMMFRIDDGRADTWEMCGHLEAYGWFATVSIIGSLVDTANHLTLEQVKELDRRGHLIINHSYEADNWTQVDSTQKAAGLLRNRQWLIDNGLTRGADIFTVPNGFTTAAANQGDMDMIFQHAGMMHNTSPTIRYYRGAANGEGVNPYNAIANGQARPWDRRCVTSFDMADGSTSQIDDCIKRGLFGQILVHDMSGTGAEPSEEQWLALLAHLRTQEAAGLCEVMTLDQIIAGDRPRGHDATATAWAAAYAG